MTKKRDYAKSMGRRGFLRAGSKLIPAIAVMGLALTVPLTARADCNSMCEGGCQGTCTGACTAQCGSD